ncbi:zinc knuckle [Ancylostoma caninum]|uniref:Zinc knuckle n=1 Tax=Ancylostoma caninum TaxID=29170 RepID=A0A368GDN1_ANCCA|nr:zinc knuckle [Ancylostoma caninum]
MEEDHQHQDEAPDAIYQEEVVSDNAIRLDPRDLQRIVDAVRSDAIPQSSQPSSSSAPVFKREGYARQYDFNLSLIRKLVPLQNYEGIGFVISSVIQDLTVRNETLKIADNHPEVFQFLDNKNKSELLKTTDPRLSEFLETIKKKDDETTRKRKMPPTSAPFRKREAAWPPASLMFQNSFEAQQGFPFDPRQQYGFQPYSDNSRRSQFRRRDPSPARRFSDSRSYYREQDRRKSLCKACGQEGHWWRDCPKSK